MKQKHKIIMQLAYLNCDKNSYLSLLTRYQIETIIEMAYPELHYYYINDLDRKEMCRITNEKFLNITDFVKSVLQQNTSIIGWSQCEMNFFDIGRVIYFNQKINAKIVDAKLPIEMPPLFNWYNNNLGVFTREDMINTSVEYYIKNISLLVDIILKDSKRFEIGFD